MEVGKISSINRMSPAHKKAAISKPKCQDIAFKAGFTSGGGNGAKNFWLMLRRLGNEMKNITEITNAFIAAIGTGIIAPIIILVSPGKGDKKDKDKKFLQALRQPLSAGLQLGFQVPATILINKGIDNLAYKKNVNFFKDEVIGDLIPTEKYLSKQVKREEIEALSARFEDVVNGKSLKQELEAKIREDYKEVGLEITSDDLALRVDKKKKDFLKEKIAKEKAETIKNAKIQDILANPDKYPKLANIKEIDLVTEDYQNLAEQRFKTEFTKLEKDANLSFFDRTMRLMGLETKKTKELDNLQKTFRKEKGLEILKKEKPDIFNDQAKKVKSYIEAYQKDANKYFGNKKFFISLLVNLFMVTISCFTLNWIHPKVNKWIESKRAEKNDNQEQKVEVA